MIENWIDFALSVVAGATAFLCLFDGTRRLGAYGLHRKAVLMTALAAALCLLYGSFAYWKYQDLTWRLIVGQTQHAPSQGRENSSRTSSPEKRENLSLARARNAFLESGKLVRYVDRSGKPKLFAPSQEDLGRRESVVVYYARLESAARISLGEALLWLITALVAAIFGFVVSFEKARTSNGPGEARSSP